MKILNVKGLPSPIVRMAEKDALHHTPKDGVLSITEFVSAPRIYQLKKRHWDTLEEDVNDKIDVMFGSAWHKALDEHKEPHQKGEVRLFAEIDGMKLSGQFDLYDPKTKTLTDHKTAKVYSYSLGEKEEYTAQLNCYRWLLVQNKMEVNRMELFWTFKDWNWRMAAKDENYPQSRALTQEVPMWELDETEAYIKERLLIHKEAEPLGDALLPGCLPKDMWEKEDTWAVKKSGTVRALRVLPSEGEAAAWKFYQHDQKGLSIQHRPGERVKCEMFCILSKNGKCSQWIEYKGANNG